MTPGGGAKPVPWQQEGQIGMALVVAGCAGREGTPGCQATALADHRAGAPGAYTPSRRSIRADSRASSCDRFFTWVVRFEMITE